KAIAAVHEAVRAAAKRVVVYCGRNRHHLMAEANRVDQTLLTEAREHVVELAPFAPDYAPERIATEATKPQLDAWRRSRELNDQHQALVRAWLTSWQYATSTSGDVASGTRQAPGHLKPRRPGGVHVWPEGLPPDDKIA